MILSVSRRTDIPAFYSDWFFNRMKEGFVYVRNPMNIHQVSRITLSPEVVDCIVFWSKNPRPMLDRLGELKDYMYYFQYTINAYDQGLEAGVPRKEGIINTFKVLSEAIGPKRVIWRYDPILLTETLDKDYHINYFEELAKRLEGYTNTCVISFVDLYKKTQRNLRDKIAMIGSDDILVLAGAATSNMENDTFSGFISELPNRDTKVILDTTGEALVGALCYHPFLIKPNINELSELFHEQFDPSDTDGIVRAAKRLQDKGARNVLTSMGQDGAVLITEDGKVYKRSAPAGIAVNTVGSGDSMVAGFLAGYLENGDMEDALCLGVCAGSASAFNEGFAKGDEIMQMYRLNR